MKDLELFEIIENNVPEVEVLLARIYCGYKKRDVLDCQYYDGLLGDALEELENFLKANI